MLLRSYVVCFKYISESVSLLNRSSIYIREFGLCNLLYSTRPVNSLMRSVYCTAFRLPHINNILNSCLQGGRLIIYVFVYTLYHTHSWILFDQIDLCLFVFFCIDLLSIAIYGQYNGNNFLHRHQVSRVILEIYLSLSRSFPLTLCLVFTVCMCQ